MANLHCTASSSILRNIFRSQTQRSTLPPAFLIPAFALPQTSSFSTTTAAQARKKKDANPRRGMSALKSSGLGKNFKLSVNIKNLPQPVPRRTELEVDPNHGLWGFFSEDRSSLLTPEELSQHGRAWTVAELRKKDFDDLWKLYWSCIKEANRINTYEKERARLKIYYGEHEADARMTEVRKTQKAIKHALTERWYQFEAARELALTDSEINLYADLEKGEPGYTPTEDVFEPSKEAHQTLHNDLRQA